MAERREEEEGGEGARRWSSGGSYRPRGSLVRGVANGGGRFGPGRLDGGLAGERAALRMAGVAWRLGEVPGTRVSVGGCQGAGQVALEGFLGSIWPRARVGRSPPAAYGGRRETEHQRGEIEVRAFL